MFIQAKAGKMLCGKLVTSYQLALSWLRPPAHGFYLRYYRAQFRCLVAGTFWLSSAALTYLSIFGVRFAFLPGKRGLLSALPVNCNKTEKTGVVKWIIHGKQVL